MVKSERATWFVSPSYLSLSVSRSPVQFTDFQLLVFSHRSRNSIQKHAASTLRPKPPSGPWFPTPSFTFLAILGWLSSLLQFQPQLHQLRNMIKFLSLKQQSPPKASISCSLWKRAGSSPSNLLPFQSCPASSNSQPISLTDWSAFTISTSLLLWLANSQQPGFGSHLL